jgi:hypothetical protein
MPISVSELQERLRDMPPTWQLREGRRQARLISGMVREQAAMQEVARMHAVSLAREAEQKAAPVVTRDAMLAILTEQREESHWARRAFWVSCASLLASLVAATAAVAALLLT